MKKRWLIVFAVLTCVFVFASCEQTCKHTLGDWEYDENGHWQPYVCDLNKCDPAPSVKVAHTDEGADGICDVCGYEISTKPTASEGLIFVINNNGQNYAVKSIGSCTDTDIVIPEMHEGLPVVCILGEAFAKNKDIQSVSIPDTVVTILENAFWECTALRSVSLGKGLKNIFDMAFAGCESLEEIALPDGLEYIYDHAFNGCAALREIRIPDSVTLVKQYAFANCTSLQSISFSDSMSLIEQNTCYGCSALESVDFGVSVRTVRKDAFSGCRSLERLYIPKNILFLEEAFKGCNNLKYMEFEETTDWKWAGPRGGFSDADVTNPEKNAERMKGLFGDGSSLKRETGA